MPTKLRIKQIETDGGTQPRAHLDVATIDDYADLVREGVKFPPVVVFYDGTKYWLADGFHRKEAHWAADLDEIECDIRQGTREDAQWYSFSANKINGLRRSTEDKQRAVQAALKHPAGVTKSDHEIAAHVGVDHKTVQGWRARMESSREIPQIATRTVTRNGATYQQNTSNIGKNKLAPSFDGGTRVTLDTPPPETPTLTPQPPAPPPAPATPAPVAAPPAPTPQAQTTAQPTPKAVPLPIAQQAPSAREEFHRQFNQQPIAQPQPAPAAPDYKKEACDSVVLVYNACTEILDCPSTSAEMAKAIRGNKSTLQRLEQTREFLTDIIKTANSN